jgi:hypothetical protein
VAANCLATAAISLADTTQHLIKILSGDVEDTEKTLVYEELEVKGCKEDTDEKDEGKIKIEE